MAMDPAWVIDRLESNTSVFQGQPNGGILRAGDLLCSWLAHDLMHIRQINTLYEYLAITCPEFSTAYGGTW